MVSDNGSRTVRYESGCHCMVCIILTTYANCISLKSALDQLSRQKDAKNKHGDDVRETLRWLDEATTRFPHAVTLQGAEDFYGDWSEVEKFVVPRTLFSENDVPEADGDTDPELDGAPDEDMSKLTLGDVTRKTPVSSAGSVGSRSASPSPMRSQDLNLSPSSPPTSPAKAVSSPVRTPGCDSASSSGNSVPQRLQSLFNFILWRIHQEIDPVPHWKPSSSSVMIKAKSTTRKALR